MEKEIKQNWDIKVVNDNPTYPFIVIDNWYTSIEEQNVWKELDFYLSQPIDNTMRAEDSKSTARKPDGTSLANSRRFYFENWWRQREVSHILSTQYKFRTKYFHNIVRKLGSVSRLLLNCNKDTSIISYYEADNDHYKPHDDMFSFTSLIWMVKEPRKFEGGDLELTESNNLIKLKSNRMVLFPSYYLHSVTPVKFFDKINNGMGRWCITHFFYQCPSCGVNK